MRHTLACLAGLSLAACTPAAPLPSTPGADRPATNVVTNEGSVITVPVEVATSSVELELPPEVVWEALAGAYQELGIEVTSRDPATRTLGNARFTPPRRLAGQRLSHYLSCGYSTTAAPLADTYRVRMSLRSQVVPSGTGSRVVTTVEATARTNSGASGAPVGCTANARLPELIAKIAGVRAGES